MTLKEELGYGLDALVLFRGLQQNPVIHALMEFCHADSSDLANQIRTYSSIVAALYPATDNLTDYMEKSYWKKKRFMYSELVQAKRFPMP